MSSCSHLLALFTAQAACPNTLKTVSLDSCSAFERLALTTDGTLTTLLSAYFLEEVRARQRQKPETNQETREIASFLNLAPGQSYRRRIVHLVGLRSERALIEAQSAVIPSRFPPGLDNALYSSPAGIGQALASIQAETHRELLWFGRTSSDRLTRAYRIIYQGHPFAVIQEIFLHEFR